ncbi:MAG: carbon-nitrogen hydrolase family protein [Firmicutes bacterium]|nr:carbon-nitrogen hydrolase family protein [Bacillota bacterium]
MEVAALSLTGLKMEQAGDYATYLSALFQQCPVELAVLPAHTAFLLWASSGQLEELVEYSEGFKLFMHDVHKWNERFLELHSELARKNDLYLVAGTTIEEVDGYFYQTAYCFNPSGEICGQQRQTHLSREERTLGLSRGDELHLIDLGGWKLGFMVGTDARHPEVGRILALQGATIVAHTGALLHGPESRTQPAGVWAQVQQNQFWAVEAQLKCTIGGRSFGGQAAVIGPCEVTLDSTGYLARTEGEELIAVAKLVEADRQRIKAEYPLLRLLQPKAYEGLIPELYEAESRENH